LVGAKVAAQKVNFETNKQAAVFAKHQREKQFEMNQDAQVADHLSWYRSLQVGHLSIFSERTRHPLHRFNLGSIREYDVSVVYISILHNAITNLCAIFFFYFFF
jgi:hypothetical protein